MAKWAARDVKCPFFRGLSEQQMSCEGVSDSSMIRLDFKGREGRREHQGHYCNSIKNYDKCPIAQMLMGKYESK